MQIMEHLFYVTYHTLDLQFKSSQCLLWLMNHTEAEQVTPNNYLKSYNYIYHIVH